MPNAFPLRVTRFADAALVAARHYLPAATVATTDLFPAPLADELLRLTGVATRHVAAPDEATSDLVIAAARPLADLYGPLIDRLLVATVTPDHPSPATAPLVQHALGLSPLAALDLSAACAGFVFALDLAARCVAPSPALTPERMVLIAAAECRFRTLTHAAPGVRVLFGDGAAAALVTRASELPTPPSARWHSTEASVPPPRALRLLATCLGADGRHHAAVRVPAGGSRLPTSPETVAQHLHALHMEDGPAVFFAAVEGLAAVGQHLIAELGLRWDDVDLIVPHQPNLRILERTARLLRVPLTRFALEVEHIGNVGGASCPIALSRAWHSGRLAPSNKVLLLTAGAGYTAGAALLEVLP